MDRIRSFFRNRIFIAVLSAAVGAGLAAADAPPWVREAARSVISTLAAGEAGQP